MARRQTRSGRGRQPVKEQHPHVQVKASRFSMPSLEDIVQSGAVWLSVIIVLHLALSMVYINRVPFGQFPDERPHAEYTSALALTGSLPVLSTSSRGNYEYHQPPLYYYLGIPFFLAGRAMGVAEPLQGIRYLSVILGMLSIIVTYAVVKRAFGEEHLRQRAPRRSILAAAFVAFLPTHVMLSSSVSNDILAELVFGTALLLIVELLTDRFTLLNTTATGIIMAIGCLTKATCVILIPVAIVAYLLMYKKCQCSIKTLAGHVLLMLFVTAAGAGWWFLRNNALYGDPLAMGIFQSYFGDTAKPEYWFSQGFTAFQYLELVATWTFASFWGVFGHMNIFMPSWIYITAAAVSLIGIAGSIKGIPEWRRQSMLSNEIWVVFATTFVLVLLAFIRFNTVFFQAQGRYLYPAIVPIAVLWVLGIEGILPRGERVMSATVIIGFPIVVQAVALSTCILAIPNI